MKRRANKPKLTAFGKMVKLELLEREMTQTELAALVGINKQYLYKILYGLRPGVKYVEVIKRILNMDKAA